MRSEEIRRYFPRVYREVLTDEFLEQMRDSVLNPEIAEAFMDNFVTYSKVMKEGRFKLVDYINAVKYVSYKLMNYSDMKAYAMTFPERMEKFREDDRTENYISGFVSSYAKNKLVCQILEQTVIPSYVLNQPLYQKALNKLGEMIDDPSVRGMAKVKACEAILAYTSPPQVIKNEVSIDVNQSSTIDELREIANQMAETLKSGMEKGITLRQIAESNAHLELEE